MGSGCASVNRVQVLGAGCALKAGYGAGCAFTDG